MAEENKSAQIDLDDLDAEFFERMDPKACAQIASILMRAHIEHMQNVFNVVETMIAEMKKQQSSRDALHPFAEQLTNALRKSGDETGRIVPVLENEKARMNGEK